MCQVPRNKRVILVYENEIHRPNAFADEPLTVHADRMLQIVRDYENNWSETHRRVHYCHKGHNSCPMCPAIYAGLTAIEDLIEISIMLKKHKLFIYAKKNAKNTGITWQTRKRTL